MANKKHRRAQQQIPAPTETPARPQHRQQTREKRVFFPLVNCDCSDKVLHLAKCNASLLECIRLLLINDYASDKTRLRHLIIVAWQVACLVDSAVFRYLDAAECEEKLVKDVLNGDAGDDLAVVEPVSYCEPETVPDYQDTPVRIRRVMALHRTLMDLIRHINKGNNASLRPYLGDLVVLTREISLTLCQSLGKEMR